MKPVGLLLSLILLGACAPKATIVEEAETPAPPVETAPAQAAEAPPPEPREDIGLLEPAGLLALPDERDMEATTEEDPGTPVIASPPTGLDATSE